MPETTNSKPNTQEKKKTVDNGEKFFTLFKEILETQELIIKKINSIEEKLSENPKASTSDAWEDM